ncbi:GyrI-like domain-containing protein [Tenacibaculum maritimum]|uniref:GyrI-like domain-containing protein n=1 Tax=Tenacibaculum maritimum TaxID=107401 RepID=UPI001E5710B6|nr:effector binding domain-containing protein [Tenacibaculum maritimum]MCD9612050.1 effector binding domain-containing protein [Tenacibaculum maritimum]
MTNGFKIIGISTRTTNKDNKSQQDLGKLWEQFYVENILEKVPNKVSNEIVSVYTDYKSDYTEDYTTIIGIPVSSLNEIPNGLIGREFQSDNFQKFIAKGEMPNAIVSTWINIWKKDNELNRKYTYDFEVYGENSLKGENSEVEIYIATK